MYHFVSREANKPLHCVQQKKKLGILQKFDGGICKFSFYLGKWI